MSLFPIFKKSLLILASLILSGLMMTVLFVTKSRAAGETFIVNSNRDEIDIAPGNGICATSGGKCTLRAAIQEANALSGSQTICFSSGMSITPTSALPAITGDYTVIDGSNNWINSGGTMVPGVVIDGNSLAASGLTINASHCAIYGIQVINFGQHGIHLQNVAEDNHIGGKGSNQRNIISHNGFNGISIEGANAKNNIVSSNYVGTSAKGLDADYGNGHHGISVWIGMDNIITDNLIGDNGWSGAAMDEVSSGTIVNNHIGIDRNGDSLPNAFYGVHIANGANPQVLDNQIAFNKRGILVEGGSIASIKGNDIYKNGASLLTPPDGGGVLISGAGSHADLYNNGILDNAALFGGGVAVENGASSVVDHNTIQENETVSDVSDSMGGGGIYVKAATITVTYNTIISNTVTGNTTSAIANGGGIYLFQAGDSWLIGNEMHGNTVIGNAGGGGGMKVFSGGNIWINNNTISENYVNTWSSGGSGIDINTAMGATHVFIEENWLEKNSTLDGGAVFAFNSDYVILTNNVIVNNNDPGLYLKNGGDHILSNFNTIAHNIGSGIILVDAHLEFYNSLVISNSEYGIEKFGVWSMAETRNDVWGNFLGGSNPSASFYLEVDPLFFNMAKGIFALRPESPCLDVGDYGHPVTTSYNGLARPIGSGYDLGAYEMPLPNWLPVVLK